MFHYLRFWGLESAFREKLLDNCSVFWGATDGPNRENGSGDPEGPAGRTFLASDAPETASGGQTVGEQWA